MDTNTIKTKIKESYGEIARANTATGCCTDTACCESGETGASMGESYAGIDGYQKDADLSLGCGLPTEIAGIRAGDTVIDLGSGAGNDAFIARRIVGETGRVIGIDMTPEMVIRALQNNQKLGFQNVEFLLGDIEDMRQIAGETADVVVSNCVLNLVPDKEKAFGEVYRILKNGGHFSISDIVYAGSLPEEILAAAEMYAGCVSGASEKGAYLGIIKSAGFKNIQVKKERRIDLPDDLLLNHLTAKQLDEFKKSGSGIYSITVYADKLNDGICCEANAGTCCGSETDVSTEKSSCCGTSSDTETRNFSISTKRKAKRSEKSA